MVNMLGKLHREAVGAQIAPKLLPKQAPPQSGSSSTTRMTRLMRALSDLLIPIPTRGRTILNSVNSPGWVSTLDRPAMLLWDDVVADGEA